MRNELFAKHREARVAEVLEKYPYRGVLAERVVELESQIHRVIGALIQDNFEVACFLEQQEAEEFDNE